MAKRAAKKSGGKKTSGGKKPAFGSAAWFSKYPKAKKKKGK